MQAFLEADPDHRPPAEVRIRILGRADLPVFADHLAKLDLRARADRFNGAVDDDRLAEYAAQSLRPGVLVVAAEHGADVIGIAELHPVAHDSGELAFSVAEGWRGRGVGAALFALIVEAAWSRGYDELLVTTHPGNEAMKALARKFGAGLRFESGESVGRVRLDAMRMLDAAAEAPRRRG
ncbi:MAG: GNAT family N-acetyltransferase [Rhizobiaceae bacterium]